MAEKFLVNWDAEIDGVEADPEPELPPPVELELLPHAARTRPAAAATDVSTIFLVSKLKSTTSSGAGSGRRHSAGFPLPRAPTTEG
jgi:hypothetical protein